MKKYVIAVGVSFLLFAAIGYAFSALVQNGQGVDLQIPAVRVEADGQIRWLTHDKDEVVRALLEEVRSRTQAFLQAQEAAKQAEEKSKDLTAKLTKAQADLTGCQAKATPTTAAAPVVKANATTPVAPTSK